MKKLTLLALAVCLLAGCMTVNITTGAGSCAPITVQLEKPISTLPLQARDVTVPMSAIP
jgi:uncharacterized protein YceK